jgi:hypothetical protein
MEEILINLDRVEELQQQQDIRQWVADMVVADLNRMVVSVVVAVVGRILVLVDQHHLLADTIRGEMAEHKLAVLRLVEVVAD